MDYRVTKDFNLVQSTASITFYNFEGEEVTTFTLNSGNIHISDRQSTIILPTEDFNNWLVEANAWFKKIKKYFNYKYPPADGNEWKYEVEKKVNEAEFSATVGGVIFSATWEGGNITLNPRDDLTLNIAEFAAFLNIHELFVEAISGRIPNLFRWNY